MTERSIFLSALEITEPSARKDYLDQACGDDLRVRDGVERLLQSHRDAGEFLAVPAPEQVAPADLAADVDRGDRGDDAPDSSAPTLHAERPLSEEERDVAEMLRRFLVPSTKPDSLGRVAHYEVKEVLGRGAFGIVLKAFDEKLHRMVAIKAMAPELAATSPPRKRFLREARSSAAVRDENLVRIYAVEEQPIPYLVMEYIPGQTLQQALDRLGPLELPEVVRLGQQIAAGLAAAHAQGLIHRDIKPANILLESGIETRVKITDFGLARAADDASLTQSGIIAGTPLYMAPEQAHGETIDQRADLFSLGSVLYVMCTGRPPFRAPTTLAVLKRVVDDTPRPIREIIPETPAWLCDIVTRLHAKRPNDRYQTAQEVADLLAKRVRDWPNDESSRPSLSSDSPERPATFRPAGSADILEDSDPPARVPRDSAPQRPGGLSRKSLIGAALFAMIGLVLFAYFWTHRSGVVRFHLENPALTVTLDGPAWTVNRAAEADPELSGVPAGEHTMRAFDGDRLVQTERFTLAPGERKSIFVRAEDPDPPMDFNGVWESNWGPVAFTHPLRQGTAPVAVTAIYYDGQGQIDGMADPTSRIFEGTFRDSTGSSGRLRLVLWKGGREISGTYGYLDQVPSRLWNMIRREDPPRVIPSQPTAGDIADFRAAKWVLSAGGIVQVNQKHRDLRSVTELPSGPFRLTLVNLWTNEKANNEAMAHFENCRELRDLDLRNTAVSDEGMRHFRGCKRLRNLSLSLTRVGDAGLAHFQGCEDLQVLGLSDTPTSDPGLSYFQHCSALRELHLALTKVTDVGLAPFGRCEELTHLQLQGTAVSDGGLARFTDCRKLTMVNVAETGISDPGLESLIRCTQLREIFARDSKVTEAGIRRMAEALPECRIDWNGGIIEPRRISASP